MSGMECQESMKMTEDHLRSDLAASLRLWRAILFITSSDLKARYKRSVLGPFWIVLTLGFGSIGIGLLWSILWGVSIGEMLTSITIGFLIWIFISTSIIDGCAAFTSNSATLNNVKLPLSFFPLVVYVRSLINFAFSWIIIIGVLVAFPPTFSWLQLMVIPGLIIAIIDIFFIVFLLAFLTARFRDLQPLVSSIIPLCFFVSPVLYKLDQLPQMSWVMMFNPFTYIITVVRDPLLGTMPSVAVYLGSICLGAASYVALRSVFNRKFRNMNFWV